MMGVRKNIGQNFQQIDVNMLSRGIYFFQFEIDAKMYFKKVVVA
nr:T9SS type A sorting domain-containing protein [Bacteroidota bacterium]